VPAQPIEQEERVDVAGKRFVVTGGASGLGAATGRALVAAGARVVLADLDETRGNALATSLGEQAVFHRTDVTSDADAEAAVALAVSRWGGLDGAVSCAGIALFERLIGRDGPHRSESFRRCIDIHLFGTFNMARAAAAQIASQPRVGTGTQGVLVHTSSVAGFDGPSGVSAYAAAKAAIAGMTLPLARELGRHGIRVASIAPGFFETPMTGLVQAKAHERAMEQVAFPKRAGDPSEFAQLVLHIIANEMINGTTLRVDAGVRLT
jgi:NAD(P)-dependent dehydrogenase (short-subunit alcohol dehydrogenase family)